MIWHVDHEPAHTPFVMQARLKLAQLAEVHEYVLAERCLVGGLRGIGSVRRIRDERGAWHSRDRGQRGQRQWRITWNHGTRGSRNLLAPPIELLPATLIWVGRWHTTIAEHTRGAEGTVQRENGSFRGQREGTRRQWRKWAPSACAHAMRRRKNDSRPAISCYGFTHTHDTDQGASYCMCICIWGCGTQSALM